MLTCVRLFDAPRHDRHEGRGGGAGAGAVADGPKLHRFRAPHGVVHAVVAAARSQGAREIFGRMANFQGPGLVSQLGLRVKFVYVCRLNLYTARTVLDAVP